MILSFFSSSQMLNTYYPRDTHMCIRNLLQVMLNYRRKSTSGWEIWNILLDFSGGSLSMVQLVGDSLAEARKQGLAHGWTGIIGNPAKFGLGLVSVSFDVSLHMLLRY